LSSPQRDEVLVPPAPPGLEHKVSPESPDEQSLSWIVTEKVLRSTNKVAVSPPFHGYGASWRLMLHPEVTHAHKGGQSFKAAKGRASIRLKCENRPEDAAGDSLKVRFQFVVGSAPARGPTTHDFAKTTIATLPTDDVWDVLSHVQQGTVTLKAEMWRACDVPTQPQDGEDPAKA
jgi:hypothetical protein